MRPRFGPQTSMFDGERTACPFCRSTELTVGICGEKIECLDCGALWAIKGLRSPAQLELRFDLTRDPREEIEDPDERPYVWDLEQDEKCH